MAFFLPEFFLYKGKGEKNILHSWKYWQGIKFCGWSQNYYCKNIIIGGSKFGSEVWYGIVDVTHYNYVSKKYWQFSLVVVRPDHQLLNSIQFLTKIFVT